MDGGVGVKRKKERRRRKSGRNRTLNTPLVPPTHSHTGSNVNAPTHSVTTSESSRNICVDQL